jgi:hypothetical protein
VGRGLDGQRGFLGAQAGEAAFADQSSRQEIGFAAVVELGFGVPAAIGQEGAGESGGFGLFGFGWSHG